MTNNNTERFSDRVADYVKFRPSYPGKLLKFLNDKIGLDAGKIIADIGSGTGISSIPFLRYGNYVYSVEPNQEMRQAQELYLKNFTKLKIIDGTAEQTNLKDNSIDIIFCGQAFHWFNREESKREFSRIQKENGNIVLAWNVRSTKTDFQKEYEQILYDHIEEYRVENYRNIEGQGIEKFFSPRAMHVDELANEQTFTIEGLKGRLQSSSYCPKGGKVYERLMKEIDRLFIRYQVNDEVNFTYETKIYWC